MFRKTVSIFLLTVFTFLTFSCYSTKIEKIVNVKKHHRVKLIRILAVADTSGKWIEFEWTYPVVIIKNAVVGTVIDKTGESKRVSIPLSDVTWVKVRKYGPGRVSPLIKKGFAIYVGLGAVSVLISGFISKL